jgi:hypothetical protein
MTRNKHTHRGTCQACGRIQAFDGVKIAKHGYTVDWGFFNGTCQGSDAAPLENDKQMTDAIIETLREHVAPAAEEKARRLRNGTVIPRWYKNVYRGGKHEQITVKREELTDYEAEQIVKARVYNAESEAREARAHAAMLEKLIEARWGKALYPVEREARKELKAGVRVRLGGKNGMDGEVVKIEGKVASGCGPYLNGQFIQHAFIKREDGRMVAIPCRLIRQDAITEVK